MVSRDDIRVVVLHAGWAKERDANVARLLRMGGRVKVWTEPAPRGVWPAFRDIVRSTYRERWLVVIQDDARVVPGLGYELPLVLEPAWPRPVGLIVGTRVVRQARARGGSFLASLDAWVGGGTAWPTDLARQLVRWCDREVRPEFPHDDRRMQLFCLARDLTGWFTAPCLVEHERMGTLLGHSHRPAGWYEHRSAAEWDWTQGAGLRWSRGLEGKTAREWDHITEGRES